MLRLFPLFSLLLPVRDDASPAFLLACVLFAVFGGRSVYNAVSMEDTRWSSSALLACFTL